jgi:prepilin-type N-terminal cleavage/methylation domain-containing protein
MIRARKRFGFTLIEVLISTLLIGLAISALLAANGSSTRINGAGVDMTTAEFLLEQIRELTAVLPAIDPETDTDTFGPEAGETLADYDDVDDFNSVTPLCPPIDAARTSLTAFGTFSQQISVENVSANNFSQLDPNSPFIRITVSVRQNGSEVCNASWIRAQY